MSCMNCGTLSFSPNFSPFGGYFCVNDHAQCEECNRKHNEHCSICSAPTEFVKMVTSKAPGEHEEQTTDDDTLVEGNAERTAPLALVKEHEQETATKTETETSVILYQRPRQCNQKHGDDKESTFKRDDEHVDERAAAVHEKRRPLEKCGRADRQNEDISFLEASQSLEDLGVLNKMASGVIFATGKRERTRSQPPGRNTKRRLPQDFDYSEQRHSWLYQKMMKTNEPMEPHRCAESLLRTHRVENLMWDRRRSTMHRAKQLDRPGAAQATTMERHGLPMRIQAGEQMHSIVDNGNVGAQLNEQVKEHMCRIEELDRMRKALERQAENEKLELLRIQGMAKKQQMHLQHRPQQRDYMAERLEFTQMTPAPLPVAKDSKKDAIDMRMENIFKSLKEEPKPTVTPAKKLVRSRPEKVRFEGVPDDEQELRNRQQQKRQQLDTQIVSSQESAQDKRKNVRRMPTVEEYLTRIRRACCVPFTMTVTSTSSCVGGTKYNVEPPAAQSMPIQATKYEINDVLGKIKRKIEDEHRNPIYISRLPVYCPDADCRRIAFISDLNTHLIHDHTALTMERISCRQAKTFFLDPHVTRDSAAKCHMLYLVKDKNIQLGDTEFGDLLPVLVMSCRLHLLDVCGYRDTNIAALKKSNPNDEILMLWLTGLVPDDVALTATLAVWPLAADYAENHTVRTCNIYSIRDSQNVRDIYNSNSAMHLTWPMVQHMSNNGVNMIGVQVVIN